MNNVYSEVVIKDSRESVERISGGYRFLNGCWRSNENPAPMLLRLIDRVEKAERQLNNLDAECNRWVEVNDDLQKRLKDIKTIIDEVSTNV